jgi:DivIVA domain-containing protein
MYPGENRRRYRELSPESIRSTRFTRTAMVRRGLSEEEVYDFLFRIADDMATLQAELSSQRNENERLRGALREWQRQYVAGGSEPADPPARAAPSNDAVALMARAQQQIDARLAEAELYCRRREQEALDRYDEILNQAHEQARADAERVAREYRATAGPGYSPDQEQVQRQRVYLVALLRAFDALAAHMDATRQAFAMEVEKLAGPAPTGAPSDTAWPPVSG